MTSLRLRAAVLAVAALPALAGAQGPAAQAAPVTAVPQPATTLPLKLAPRPTTAAITAADLMTRLYIFADDSMMGRESGTIGNVRGTDYIAREAARLGLRPAGDNGTFFQTIPFKRRALDPTSTVKVAGAALANGADWALIPGTSAPSGTLQAVYGGTLGDNSPRIGAAEAQGKLVVYRVLPTGLALLQDPSAFPAGRAAIGLTGLDRYIPFLSAPTTIVDDPARATPLEPPVVIFSQGAAGRLFAAGITPSVGTPGATTSFDVRTSLEPLPVPSRNVVAVLPGADAQLRGQYVAIGAHNDHVGYSLPPVDHDSMRIFNHVVRPGGAEDESKVATEAQVAEVNAALGAWRAAHPGSSRPDSIANGADDDGSGSMTVLEIAERMATRAEKPKRSVLFVWHNGEEKGLLGSEYFTDNPTVPRDSIVGQLNIDMVGRGNAWDVTGVTKDGAPLRGAPDYLQLVGSRRLSTELGDLIETVNREGRHGLSFDYGMDANGHPMNIYCRSDHYEYARYGIPVTFFTTGGHSDYHQVTDEPQYIDYPHMARIASLVTDVASRIASLDHRLVVDKPKPDPKGTCQQ